MSWFRHLLWVSRVSVPKQNGRCTFALATFCGSHPLSLTSSTQVTYMYLYPALAFYPSWTNASIWMTSTVAFWYLVSTGRFFPVLRPALTQDVGSSDGVHTRHFNQACSSSVTKTLSSSKLLQTTSTRSYWCGAKKYIDRDTGCYIAWVIYSKEWKSITILPRTQAQYRRCNFHLSRAWFFSSFLFLAMTIRGVMRMSHGSQWWDESRVTPPSLFHHWRLSN